MKVVVIDPWCFTPPYDRELCRGLASNGHEVTFIGQHQGIEDGLAAISSTGISTLRLFTAPRPSSSRFLTLLAKGLRHIQGLVRSLRALRRLQPDVIHLQWLPLPLVDALFVPLFRRIAPVVLTVHDSNPYNGAGPLLLRLGHLLAMRRCDRWIVHNAISEQRLTALGLPADCIHRIAHGLLSPPVEGPLSTGRRRDGRIHFLQFGKIKEYKGVDLLLKAVGSLNQEERARCRVSIVGRPYLDTQSLFDLMDRFQLDQCVDLRLDFVSDDEMAALFDEADALVFPYRGIDTSGVLMAAIARGIPVIATELGCFAEMLNNGEEGLLVPPEDPGALAGALRLLIDDPNQAETMRRSMLDLQQRIPSWERIAEETTDVYRRAQRSPVAKPVGALT